MLDPQTRGYLFAILNSGCLAEVVMVVLVVVVTAAAALVSCYSSSEFPVIPAH